MWRMGERRKGVRRKKKIEVRREGERRREEKAKE